MSPKKAAKKRSPQLRWDNDAMTWRDKNQKACKHPRYADKPKSLDGKLFMNAYLNTVRKGESLNDFMKVNGKFTDRQVQAQARKLRKAYQDVTAAAGEKDSFPLLKQKKAKKADSLGLTVAETLVAIGYRNATDPRVKFLKED